jgi:hypothetical protein
MRSAETQETAGLSKLRVSSATSSGALKANLGLVLRKLNGRGLDCGLNASKPVKTLVSII